MTNFFCGNSLNPFVNSGPLGGQILKRHFLLYEEVFMGDLHSVQQSGHWSITPYTANNRVGPQKWKYAKHLKDILPILL